MNKNVYFIILSLIFLYFASYKNDNESRLYVIYHLKDKIDLSNYKKLPLDLIEENTFLINNYLNVYDVVNFLDYSTNKVKKNSKLLSDNFHQIYFLSKRMKKQDLEKLDTLVNKNLTLKVENIEFIYVE